MFLLCLKQKKLGKTSVALIISFLMIFSAIFSIGILPGLVNADVVTATGSWVDFAQVPTGAGTSVSPYQISSAENMAWLIGRTHNGINYKLAADIDMSAHFWTPIVTFTGNIDGAIDADTNYSVSGVVMDPTSAISKGALTGLFAAISNPPTGRPQLKILI